MRLLLSAPLILCLGSFVSAQTTLQGRVLDLGHPLNATAPSWTGDRVFERVGTGDLVKDGYTGGRFASDEHFGTHLDAPAHFGGDWTVDKIPVERLVRPGVCIHVEERAAADDDYQLSVADIDAFERAHGVIPPGAMVFVATGWDSRWPDAGRYMNDRDGVKHFPGVSVAAAQRLLERGVAGIGIDTASIDYGPSTSFEAHRTTMRRNVYHVENAANLRALPPTGFVAVLAPINIEGGSGGPTRVFALVR